MLESGVVEIALDNVYDSISADKIDLNERVHLAVTVNRTCVPEVFINGRNTIVKLQSAALHDGYKPIPSDADFNASLVDNVTSFTIGRNPISAYGGPPPEAWQGSIDELVIFDRVLTAQDILEHYGGGKD